MKYKNYWKVKRNNLAVINIESKKYWSKNKSNSTPTVFCISLVTLVNNWAINGSKKIKLMYLIA